MRPFIIATLFVLSAVSISHGNDRVIVPAGFVVEAPALLQYSVYLVRGLDRSPKKAATALLKAKYKTFSLVDKPDPKKKCVFIQVVDDVREAYRPPDGSKEWMWVEVLAWGSPDEITGILKNQPYNIPELKAGMEVKIKTSDVFDYIHRLPTGETEGNETGKLIQKYSK